MTSMIEKAARAIHDTLENDDDSGGGGYMRAARAVLQAIRDPDEAMIEAGQDELRRWDAPAPATTVWRAMLDINLQDTSGSK